MKIRTKAEFFRLWNAGALGYKLRTWDRPEDVDPDVPIVGFRQIGKAGGGRLDIVPRTAAVETGKAWLAAGLRYMVCEAAPDAYGTLQGEVCRGLRGWEGYLGPVIDGRRMRESIRDGHLKPRSSSETLVLLRSYLSAASLDDLYALLDLYPDATVELTAYSKEFERGRNTIFWEVRDY